MVEVSLLQQILNGGTPLLLFVGLVIVGKLYLKSQDDHNAERIRDREMYEQKLAEKDEAYRTFTQTISDQQAAIFAKVSESLDRNTAAFERSGSEEKAKARQDELLGLLKQLVP